jgi:hypothetical protein
MDSGFVWTRDSDPGLRIRIGLDSTQPLVDLVQTQRAGASGAADRAYAARSPTSSHAQASARGLALERQQARHRHQRQQQKRADAERSARGLPDRIASGAIHAP